MTDATVETAGLNIIFKDAGGDIIWTGDDMCKMRAWTHLNPKVEDFPAEMGGSVDLGGDGFKIVDVQPVIGWALGTCWELTLKRILLDDNGE